MALLASCYNVNADVTSVNIVVMWSPCLSGLCLHFRVFKIVLFMCCLPTFSSYTFDTRKLKQPLQVHMDHVSAVTAIDYAPTGKEFVSGGYDKSVRIFEHGKVNYNCIILVYYMMVYK